MHHFSHGLTVHGVQLGYFPNGPRDPSAVGIFVDTLPKALLTALVCLLLLVLFSYVLVLTARTHANVAGPCSARRKTPPDSCSVRSQQKEAMMRQSLTQVWQALPVSGSWSLSSAGVGE